MIKDYHWFEYMTDIKIKVFSNGWNWIELESLDVTPIYIPIVMMTK